MASISTNKLTGMPSNHTGKSQAPSAATTRYANKNPNGQRKCCGSSKRRLCPKRHNHTNPATNAMTM